MDFTIGMLGPILIVTVSNMIRLDRIKKQLDSMEQKMQGD